jgi:hypothetical protein
MKQTAGNSNTALFYWDVKLKQWVRRATGAGVRLYWSETLKRWVSVP